MRGFWFPCYTRTVKFTQYFLALRLRPDRAFIRDGWIQHVIESPVREPFSRTDASAVGHQFQRWTDGFCVVILLPDAETVHNAFFDRSFTP